VFNGKNTKEARKTCSKKLWKITRRTLDQIDSVVSLDELKIPPGNLLEKLTGDRNGEYSIRINEKYRICFVWSDTGPELIQITDYH